MGAVAERSTLTVADIREEVGIPATVSDGRVGRWLAEAFEAADTYLNNPFVQRDEDGEPVDPQVDLPIPAGVDRGVIEYVRWRWTASPSNGGGVPLGVTSESVGDLSKSYAASATLTGSVGDDIARQYWSRYRLEPGL